MHILRNARLLLLILCLAGCGATAVRSGPQPPVVLDTGAYRSSIRTDPSRALLDLRGQLPSARLDIRYATPGNFMHRVLYPRPDAWLRRPAAVALARVVEDLRTNGLGLIVFDAYRPYSVTREMWDAIHDDRFVADPAKGSRHNRGCAVDVSLYDLASAKELEMPTGYDDFTTRAAQNAPDVTATAARNRELLRDTMHRHGFDPLASEWWHYDFTGWKDYELLDVPFEDLRGSVSLTGLVGRLEAAEFKYTTTSHCRHH
ncbi:MAG TPA: M15 family metallopeptidase [Thermoanaerobaculia bacterium]|nr:M15 family metallopeptidase [Thermoanaerobaculia bacterium]